MDISFPDLSNRLVDRLLLCVELRSVVVVQSGETVNIEEYWGELSVLNVKSMEVWNFQGRYDHDLDFLKSVLKHAVGLEKLTVSRSKGQS